MIELDRLSFGYRTGHTILQGLTHRFVPGTVTSLTGSSGSGKSTLLYLIGLMLAPKDGRILIDGVNVSGLSDSQRSAMRAERMGFVFQDALLDPSRSLVDNVCEGSLYHSGRPHDIRQRAVRLLRHYGVFADPLRRPGQISGGQAQRVALCRALISDPTIVLADEPTGNLDRESSDLVWATLTGLAQDGATVVVATHDRARAAACDIELRVADAAAA